MSFDYDLKSNLVAMISNHSQSQSKLQLDKETGLLNPLLGRGVTCTFFQREGGGVRKFIFGGCYLSPSPFCPPYSPFTVGLCSLQ